MAAARQHNGKRGSLTQRRTRDEGSAVSLDGSVRNRQAKPASTFPSREERIEDARKVLRIDARPVIDDPNSHRHSQ